MLFLMRIQIPRSTTEVTLSVGAPWLIERSMQSELGKYLFQEQYKNESKVYFSVSSALSDRMVYQNTMVNCGT